jgi:hypothetical protein
MTTMTTLALPVLPGKEEQTRRFVREMAGPRREESIAAAKGIGVQALNLQLQTGPQGALLLVTIVTDDPTAALRMYAAADSPYDRWEKQQFQEITGVDFNASSDGPLPETLYDWRPAG